MNYHRLAALSLMIVLVRPHFARSDEPEVGANPVITNSIGMKLAPIPTGTFIMGSPRNEAERDDKEERHEVSITKPFYLGVYEVTQAEYVEVMKNAGDFKNRSTFGGDNSPVENVEWKVAKIFCEQLTSRAEEAAAKRKYRLPTEAEWEYACRAGTSTAFHFGDALSSDQANFNGTFPAGGGATGKYLRQTAPVGSYPPNAFGLHDMHGNVAEWCSDWYDPEYYLNSPDEDPLGPPFGVVSTKFTNNGNQNYFVVIRGGCWVDEGRALRSAYRYRAMPNTQYRLVGFRVACDVEQE
ncbi:MAG: formylglycine-generating enzyme family protein [Planctomycetota bacterium]